MNKKTKIITFSLLSTAFLGFVLFMILAMCEYNFKIDSFNNFVANNRTDFMVKFLKMFTHLGSFYTLAMLTIVGFLVLFFVVKKKRLAVFSAGSFALVAILNFIFKQIVRRDRPFSLMIIDETGFSFPSGHAMMSFGFFAICAFVVCLLIKNKSLKISLICLFSTLMVFIGFSRIYLGVHYLSDILAGWLLSFSALICCWLVYRSKMFKFIKDDEKQENITEKAES